MFNLYVLDGKSIRFVTDNGGLTDNIKQAHNFKTSSSKLFNDCVNKAKASNYKYGVVDAPSSQELQRLLKSNFTLCKAISTVANNLGLAALPFVSKFDGEPNILSVVIINIHTGNDREFFIMPSGEIIDMETDACYRIVDNQNNINNDIINLFRAI